MFALDVHDMDRSSLFRHRICGNVHPTPPNPN